MVVESYHNLQNHVKKKWVCLSGYVMLGLVRVETHEYKKKREKSTAQEELKIIFANE